MRHQPPVTMLVEHWIQYIIPRWLKTPSMAMKKSSVFQSKAHSQFPTLWRKFSNDRCSMNEQSGKKSSLFSAFVDLFRAHYIRSLNSRTEQNWTQCTRANNIITRYQIRLLSSSELWYSVLYSFIDVVNSGLWTGAMCIWYCLLFHYY